MTNCNPVKSPLDIAVNLHAREETEESADDGEYRALIGKLQHLAIYSRADLTYAATSTEQNTSVSITARHPHPVGFPEASYINDHNDRKSTSGGLFMINNGLIAFASKKQSKIAQSSAEAEIMALNEAARESYFIRHLLSTLPFAQLTGPTTLLADSAPAISNIRNNTYNNRTKHIDVKFL
jgi:hypothetical protein